MGWPWPGPTGVGLVVAEAGPVAAGAGPVVAGAGPLLPAARPFPVDVPGQQRPLAAQRARSHGPARSGAGVKTHLNPANCPLMSVIKRHRTTRQRLLHPAWLLTHGEGRRGCSCPLSGGVAPRMCLASGR